jgi:molybdate transport system ATP-binding protein
LVRRPDVLLLDEVLNGLDAPSRRAFLRALRRVARSGTAWMLATHRAADRPAGVTHVARLERGRLAVFEANTSRSRAAAGVSRRGRRLVADGGSRGATDGGPPLIVIEAAAVHRDERPVITGLEWRIRPGEHWCIAGANGTGKSTLMALLYGDLSPALGGRILRDGCPPGIAIEEWKQRTGLVSPELQATYAATACTLEEVVVSGLHSSIGLNDPPPPGDLALARRWLARVGLAGLGRHRARQVSYGQLRLALLARALVRPRTLLLLDEPFDGLDARSRAIASREVEVAVKNGTQVVFATHHDDDVPTFVGHRLELRNGRARRGGRTTLGRAARPAQRCPQSTSSAW